MSNKSTINDNNQIKKDLLSDALEYVPFYGWSQLTIKELVSKKKYNIEEIDSFFPRGGVDLALFFHQMGDELMVKELISTDFSKSRIRDRIAAAINLRLNIALEHRLSVKKSLGLFSTPMYIHDGSQAIWYTADKIWIAIGDKSYDINFYSKRIILSAVYSACLLYWLDDESQDFVDSREFIKRRIDNVMFIEKLKGQLRKLPFTERLEKSSVPFFTQILNHKDKFPGWRGQKN